MSAPDTRATWTDCLAENAHLRAEVAGLPLELERRTKHLRGEVEELHAKCAEYLAEIKALHHEFRGYYLDDCKDCDGKGEVEEVVTCDYPSRLDPMQPAEETIIVKCPRCHGTKMEWIT